MDLGRFYVALAVKDIKKSLEFYQKLGFSIYEGVGGIEQKWLIIEHHGVTLGLYEGMFEDNVLTFNPQAPSEIRDIQKTLKKNGLELTKEADESTTGPEHITLIDPDGNPILIDQHY